MLRFGLRRYNIITGTTNRMPHNAIGFENSIKGILQNVDKYMEPCIEKENVFLSAESRCQIH